MFRSRIRIKHRNTMNSRYFAPQFVICLQHNQVTLSRNQNISWWLGTNFTISSCFNGLQECLRDTGSLADLGPIIIWISVGGTISNIMALLTAAETNIRWWRRSSSGTGACAFRFWMSAVDGSLMDQPTSTPCTTP